MAEGGKVKNTGNKVSAQQKTRQAYESPRVRVRENKHATDAGLTEEQRKAVNATESKIRNRKTEIAYAVDDNGQVIKISVSGSRNRTRINPGLVPRNAVLTHNHPSAEDKPIMYNGRKVGVSGGGSGMAAKIVAPHSGADLRAAILLNAKETRAVSPTYTFSVRRPEGGWNVSADEVEREWNKVYDSFKKEYESYRKSGREQFGRFNLMASHQATRAVAKKYGFTYTRRKA